MAKTDLRYWHGVIFHSTYTKNRQRQIVPDWSAKIQHEGRRETFGLGTPNRSVAAAFAREIYLFLKANGWTATVAKFKRQRRLATTSEVATIGDFLQAIRAHFGGKQKTIDDYCRAFRHIVAGISGIDADSSKYDYRAGGRERWLARIDRIRLNEVTPARVQRWKVDFIRRAGTNPLKLRAARNSVNSLLRQAKSLFSPDHLQFLPPSVGELNPFKGVSFEPRQSMRYRSDFNVERLIEAAQRELPNEHLKIFLLALFAGLRRNEIDKLEWNAFRWDEGLIRIAATQYFQPKSEDALNDVEVDPELLEIFRGFRASASGSFVIESHVSPRTDAGYSHYRCEHHFTALAKWLRDQAVNTNNPIHTLRKEFGSQICSDHGIYAASQALRHADIMITSQHYVDNRRRATVGLGRLLSPPDNVVQLEQNQSNTNSARTRPRAR